MSNSDGFSALEDNYALDGLRECGGTVKKKEMIQRVLKFEERGHFESMSGKRVHVERTLDSREI